MQNCCNHGCRTPRVPCGCFHNRRTCGPVISMCCPVVIPTPPAATIPMPTVTSDTIVYEQPFLLAGTGIPGATVSITNGNQQTRTALVNSNGYWAISLDGLSAGVNTFQLMQMWNTQRSNTFTQTITLR